MSTVNRSPVIRCPIQLLLLATCIFAINPQLPGHQLSIVGKGEAARIYRDASASVFLVSLCGPNGETFSVGSGFLIGNNKLLTSLHVIAGKGDVIIGQHDAGIPARVSRTDALDDLAILTIKDGFSAKPLALSDGDAVPGEDIFAIGNPDGLEKTISTGVVAGIRDFYGRKLLQITAPICHGSSGGPVLDANGYVIGLAAATLLDGQNLNFAVPASEIRKFVADERSEHATAASLLQRSVHIRELQENEAYSQDAGSPWQQADSETAALLESAIKACRNEPDLLIQVAKEAQYHHSDIQIEALQEVLRTQQSPEMYILLGEALDAKAGFDSSPDMANALNEAEQSFRSAIKIRPSARAYYDLGRIFEHRAIPMGSMSADRMVALLNAKEFYLKALSLNNTSGLQLKNVDIWRALLRVASLDSDAVPDHDKYFQLLAGTGSADASDWEGEAVALFNRGKFMKSGDAYLTAIKLKGSREDPCWAANSIWIAYAFGEIEADARSWNLDRVLSNARNCVDQEQQSSGGAKSIALGHRMIFNVLYEGGVYSEALLHAKQAADLDPTDPWLFHSEAEAFYKLEEFDKAITADTEAIRLSDGKHSEMHSQLGLSYFALQRWNSASQTFEKAAELDPNSASSAFNAGLCELRMGHSREALRWMHEVLRRDPKYQDRAEVEHQIKMIEANTK